MHPSKGLIASKGLISVTDEAILQPQPKSIKVQPQSNGGETWDEKSEYCHFLQNICMHRTGLPR